MNLTLGLLLVLAAGVLQGTFVLPMTLTRRWQWEHTWAAFSLFGMLLFNWAITLSLIPNVWSIWRHTAPEEILSLLLFGAGWGVGAVLFGLGMARLGMALGYPIIMGLIASLGALIPLAWLSPGDLLTIKGILLLSGTAAVVIGIVLCSNAAVLKQRSEQAGATSAGQSLKAGLVICVAAGVLSCLPNVGLNFAPKDMPGNAVWALLFTAGFAVNFAYCGWLMFRHGNGSDWIRAEPIRNFALSAVMGAMWIGSFHLYGAGASRLGDWGGIVGWPLFICLAIGVGNLWGLWRGEWRGAPNHARTRLSQALAVLALAILMIAISSAFSGGGP